MSIANEQVDTIGNLESFAHEEGCIKEEGWPELIPFDVLDLPGFPTLALPGVLREWVEAEAAALLGVARHTLRDCRLRGEIKGRLVGKKMIYSREELLRFLRAEK